MAKRLLGRRKGSLSSEPCTPHNSTHVLTRSSMRVATLDQSLHSEGLSRSISRSVGSTTKSTGSINSVQFHKIHIREYERTVGDNPSCSGGPPVAIGWNYEKQVTTSLDEYESERGPRREMVQLALPKRIRTEILRNSGASRKDMADAVRKTIQIKNNRRTTVNNLGNVTKVEELWESALRKVGRFVQRKDRDKVEYAKWKAEFEKAKRVVEAKNAVAMEEFKLEQLKNLNVEQEKEQPPIQVIVAEEKPEAGQNPLLEEDIGNLTDTDSDATITIGPLLRRTSHTIVAEE